MIKYVADPQDVLPAITCWLMGSLSATNGQTLTLGAPFILVGTAMIFALRWRLNVLSLNEDEAHTLGVNCLLYTSCREEPRRAALGQAGR